jgi:hypothetical protein
VTDDPDAAREVMRKDLVPYFSLPFYRAMIERSGFEPDIEKADAFIDTLAAIGTVEEAKAVIDRYFEAGATSPCVGPIAKADFEATLRALSR